MNAGHPQPCTEGASQFDPDVLFDDWGNGRKLLPENHDLRSAIISIFSLSKNDSYVYHAIASVTLSQVQAAIGHGAGFGLHAWYLDNEGSPVKPSYTISWKP